MANDIQIINPQNCIIEEYTYIGPEAKLQCLGNVIIKRGSILGPGIKIYTGNHNYKNAKSLPYDEKYNIGNVIIEENVWIVGYVIILPNVKICEGANSWCWVSSY